MSSSVRLYVPVSAHLEQAGFERTVFKEIWYLSAFLNYDEKIQVWLKFDKYNGRLTWIRVYIYDTSLNYFILA